MGGFGRLVGYLWQFAGELEADFVGIIEGFAATHEGDIVASLVRTQRNPPMENPTRSFGSAQNNPAPAPARLDNADLLSTRLKAKDSQSNLFEVARGLRLPASLILGPLEQIATDSAESTTRRQAEIALRNAKDVMRSLNQMIAFQALQSGETTLAPRRMDLVAYVNDHVAHFRPLCREKGLKLTVEAGVESLEADIDASVISEVLNNLVSNAIKFTPRGGIVNVKTELRLSDEGMVRICVRDSGRGIGEDLLPFVFDATGTPANGDEKPKLGLPLTQKMVELHGGTIKLNTIEGLGTEVSVLIPRNQKFTVDSEKDEQNHAAAGFDLEAGSIRSDSSINLEWESNDGSGKMVLLIESNPDLRDFIRLALEPGYRVIEAADGPAGLSLATQMKPDMVICADELPGISGLDVCRKLNEEPLTAHLPVIMLGQNTTEARIAALQTGADALLNRRPEICELRAWIERLFAGRQQFREHFRGEMIAFSPVTEATSMEDQFLNSIHQAMAKNLTNEAFSVEDLAAELAMSRTQLHRKLKAIGDQSASTFMRNYRLERAYQLLSQNVAGVGEVAFMVGFVSASYFSKAFSAKYGKSPREVRKNAANPLAIGAAKKQSVWGEADLHSNIRISA